jgi:predicted 2-oxoglutarate/Fe(II)-dependent dioxygenase YbiX
MDTFFNKKMEIKIYQDPWPHVIIENVLSKKGLVITEDELQKHKQQFKTLKNHPAKIKYSEISNLPIYKGFTSELFKNLCYFLTHKKYKINSTSGIQFRFSNKNTPEFPLHHDFIDKESIVILLYLSDLKEKDGGELVLVHPRNRENFKSISPGYNKLVFFASKKNNLHKVNRIKRGNRFSILLELVTSNINKNQNITIQPFGF